MDADTIRLIAGIVGPELVAVGIAAWWLDKRCDRRIADVKWMIDNIRQGNVHGRQD